MKQFLKERCASDIMTRRVISIEPGTPVPEIFRVFLKNHIMGVPVVDKEMKVVGIVTERDLAVREEDLKTPASVNLLGSVVYLEDMDRYNELLRKKMGQLAKDVMTAPVHTLPESTPLGEILTFMEEQNLNRVPIVNAEEKLSGIVTRTDIIREMAREGKNV